MALYLGMSLEELRNTGMCKNAEEARIRASNILRDPELAVLLSEAQEPIRKYFCPENWRTVISGFIENVKRKESYFDQHSELDGYKLSYSDLLKKRANIFVAGIRAYME